MNDAPRQTRPWMMVSTLFLLTIACIGWWIAVRSPSLSEIEAQIKRGEVAKAIPQLTELLQQRPDDIDARQLLARCLEVTQQHDAAADAYAKCLHFGGSSWPMQMKHAENLLKAARLEEAEAAYRAMLAVRPADEVVRTELQWILFNQTRIRELEAFLESCLKREPDNFQLLYHLLYSSQRPPNPRENVGKMEMVDRLQPGQAAIQFSLGLCYWQLGELAKAHSYFNKCCKDADLVFERDVVIAEFLIEQGDLKRAADLLTPPKTQAAIWRQDDRWWWLQGQLEFQDGNFQQALLSVEEALRRRPGEARYLVQAASLQRALGNTAEAESITQQISKLQTAQRELYILVNRGDVNRPDQALCRKLSRLCKEIGKTQQSHGWQMLTDQVR